MTRASAKATPVRRGRATVMVSIRDPRLSRAMVRALSAALGAAPAAHASIADVPFVRLRTRRRLDLLTRAHPERLSGAIALVRVTDRSARRLADVVAGVRAAGALGVQVVWDGVDPSRSRVERHVFAALERARATPNGAPVVLAKTEEPAAALLELIAHRQRKDVP